MVVVFFRIISVDSDLEVSFFSREGTGRRKC